MDKMVHHLPLDFGGLTPELTKQAKYDFLEDSEITKCSLQNLKTLIKDGNTVDFPLEEADLLPFLRARKFDAKKAYLLFCSHISMIGKHDLLFGDFKYSSLQQAMQSDSIGILPKRDSDGCIIVVFFLDKWNPHEVAFVEIVRTAFMGILSTLRYPATQIAGVKIIQDYKNLSVRKLTFMPPWVFKFAIDAMQNILPMRVKGVHFVNNGYLFYYIWAILKPLLSRKLRERIHFHGSDLESLHEFISPSILPEELGGVSGPHSNMEYIKFMRESEEYVTNYIKRVRKENY